MQKAQAIAPGARILVRDAEWLVRKVDYASQGGQAIDVIGITELVKNKEAVFLTEIEGEKGITLLNPKDTELVQDESSSYKASLLYMESLLRRVPPTDKDLYIGHRAAMDLLPFQLVPALQALEAPRQRILIADSVGLGKTMECGILVSELIRRGKGKRILAITNKSMLTQFQKELWSRFTIPLTRLDSLGLQRIRANIPTNHNPFYYYDKSIISIDTLKNDKEYRVHLENAYWDIIIIDEAQNVAERGSISSLRAKLAKLLANRSDTLIMLSATPHDGKPESFASLMNMLDPTAIADVKNYGPEDIKKLYVRRFKKDIKDQVKDAFKEREPIRKGKSQATPAEEEAFEILTKIQFKKLDQRSGASQLFKTTLEKALFSSPAACLQTIENRIKKLENREGTDYEEDIDALKNLRQAVSEIGPNEFSKYGKLLEVIKNIGWLGKEPNDRLIIFTERIDTLRFLKENLPGDLKLKENRVAILHGSMPDVDQQTAVEDFGKDNAPVRLLIASDVASEGINLHYLSHRMLHFDIPWSLMVFQQRNGRIDRYGQNKTPQIIYMLTESENEKIKGDTRILEILIEKEDHAHHNLGDPAVLMDVYDVEEEEKITAKAIEETQSPDHFESMLDAMFNKKVEALISGEAPAKGDDLQDKTKAMISLFKEDFDYLRSAIDHLRQNEKEKIDVVFDLAKRRVDLLAPEDLQRRFRFFPREIRPENWSFALSANTEEIQKEIKRCRKEESAWPQIHYLWGQNPIVEWISDRVLSAFGRHDAPIITIPEGRNKDEVLFLMSGLIPNRKGHPLIHQWFGVVFIRDKFFEVLDFQKVMDLYGLGTKPIPNRNEKIDLKALKKLLPKAVDAAYKWVNELRDEFEEKINIKLNEHLEELEKLRKSKLTVLEERYEQLELLPRIKDSRKEREKREIKKIFDEYMDWVQDTMTTEKNPYLKVIAVLKAAK